MTKIKADFAVGIYNWTEAVMRIYGKSKAVVTMPTVKWSNNSGSLAYYKVKLTSPKKIADVRTLFESGYLCDDYGLTIEDYLFNAE